MNWIKNKCYVLFFKIFLLSFFYSCDKEIVIDLPVLEQKMVVYSLITPFTPPNVTPIKVQLWSSYPILDTTEAEQITDAEVLLYTDGILFDTFHFDVDLDGYTNGKFVFPEAGKRYDLKIAKSGFQSVSATNYIPARVTMKDLEIKNLAGIDEFQFAYSSVAVKFEDPASKRNYYEITISYIGEQEKHRLWTTENSITEESYYPSVLAFDKKKPKRLLFSDKQFNGKEKTLVVFYQPSQYENPDKRWIIQHFIDVSLRSVSEEYYKYYTSLMQHSYSQEEDLLYGIGEPIDVQGNINGGYGIFAGYNGELRTCFVDSITFYRK